MAVTGDDEFDVIGIGEAGSRHVVGHIIDVDNKLYRTYARTFGASLMVSTQLQFIKKREHSVEELSSIVALYITKRTVSMDHVSILPRQLKINKTKKC